MAEIISAPPSGRPALVLNADFRPLSYYPLSLWPWQEVVKAVFLDRVDIIAEYDYVVRSPSTEFRLPSVIALRDFVRQDRPPAFTRFNVFLRDGFECAYCGTSEHLTFDHVIPRSKGGRTTWENIVAACSPALFALLDWSLLQVLVQRLVKLLCILELPAWDADVRRF